MDSRSRVTINTLDLTRNSWVKALPLRVARVDERHQAVTLFTEHSGIISAFAKNSVHSRRFGSCLSPWAASRFRLGVARSSGVHLEEAELIRSFDGLAREIDRLQTASAMNLVTQKTIAPGAPARDFFALYGQGLRWADEINLELLPSLWIWFSVRLARLHGLLPDPRNCILCRHSIKEGISLGPIYFDEGTTGFKCSSCAMQKIDGRTPIDSGQRTLWMACFSLFQRGLQDSVPHLIDWQITQEEEIAFQRSLSYRLTNYQESLLPLGSPPQRLPRPQSLDHRSHSK